MIELLVVIAIIAVLMYLDDYNRKFPHTQSSNGHLWKNGNGTWRDPGSGGGTYWGTFYRDYMEDNTKIFGCPSLQRLESVRTVPTSTPS